MKLLKFTGSPEKKTEKLNGSPICPIKVGRIAVIPKDGKLYHTSKVIALHECTKDLIHFETLHTHYYMSMTPFRPAAVSPLPLSLAA